jgi:hypothetical protein
MSFEQVKYAQVSKEVSGQLQSSSRPLPDGFKVLYVEKYLALFSSSTTNTVQGFPQTDMYVLYDDPSKCVANSHFPVACHSVFGDTWKMGPGISRGPQTISIIFERPLGLY